MMENRNILMVGISITALFIIIFGIALMITWPRDSSEQAEVAGVVRQAPPDVVSWMRDNEPLPGLEPKPTATIIPQIIGDLTTIGDNAGKDSLDIPVLPGITIKETTDDQKNTRQPSGQLNITYNTTETRQPQPKPVQKIVPRVTKAPVPTRVVNYWIQAGSFRSKDSAEEQNSKLAEKGFFGQVQTRNIDNATYYRVRIGPYTRKAEADKFLAWIKEVKDMEGSYVSEVYVLQ